MVFSGVELHGAGDCDAVRLQPGNSGRIFLPQDDERGCRFDHRQLLPFVDPKIVRLLPGFSLSLSPPPPPPAPFSLFWRSFLSCSVYICIALSPRMLSLSASLSLSFARSLFASRSLSYFFNFYGQISATFLDDYSHSKLNVLGIEGPILSHLRFRQSSY